MASRRWRLAAGSPLPSPKPEPSKPQVSNILAQISRPISRTTSSTGTSRRPHRPDLIGVEDSHAGPTDTTGTWVGSSHLWASVRTGHRLGELMLKWTGNGRPGGPAPGYRACPDWRCPTHEGAGWRSELRPQNPVAASKYARHSRNTGLDGRSGARSWRWCLLVTR